MKLTTIFSLLLIVSAAVILAQTTNSQQIHAKVQCEDQEDGGFTCQGGQGGCGTEEEVHFCGGHGGRSDFDDASRDEGTTSGGHGEVVKFRGEVDGGGEGGRQDCKVDPDTNTQDCKRVGSRYN